ncbi:fasciclin domain-containing protein [Geitlerinema sp. P-1104]|uniref:fasciclin domain-containing protein n=1 Tax=Geitlerinema sp. P-1104 TaxID=2546230 RepID=UPI001476CC17|nr:fasciclin domain-containing protein [Geitlerinema sp. P-1104]NMG60425.1 fasciclin domain-containing protein [Geitlerinema sp. P-1104]
MNSTRRFQWLTGAMVLLSASTLTINPSHADMTASEPAQPLESEVAQMGVGNLVDSLAGQGDMNTLLQLAELAGMADTLANDGPFTLFAPTDQAFQDLPQSVVNALTDPANRDLLQDVLGMHVVPEILEANDIGNQLLNTLNGPVNARVQGNRVNVGPARVIDTDIPADNGVIHKIDTVIVPGDLQSRLNERTTTTTTETETTTTETTTTTPRPTPTPQAAPRTFPVTW